MMKLLPLLLVSYAAAETLVEQASNPHMRDQTCAPDGAFADLLEMPHLALLKAQADTFQGKTFARTPGGAHVPLYDFKQPKRLSDAELPFSVAPVQWRRNDPRLFVSSTPPHADSWFEGYGWQVVHGSTPCGAVHLGWLYSDGTSEFLALIVRPGKDRESVWSIGNPAHVVLAAMLATSAGRIA
eukprot:Hpha_TRINITY_DN5593_c0_g1::TRINITY_DN5593_c0_g1_i1::g.93744::m.93744